MAELYIQILEEYVTSSTVEDLKECCSSKVPSFAGFSYESLFLHITNSESLQVLLFVVMQTQHYSSVLKKYSNKKQ